MRSIYFNKIQIRKRSIAGWLSTIIIFFLTYSTTMAQIPEGVPHPDQNTPIDFSSWSDIVIYIILPSVLIIGYIIMIYRRRRRKQEGKNKNNPDEI